MCSAHCAFYSRKTTVEYAKILVWSTLPGQAAWSVLVWQWPKGLRRTEKHILHIKSILATKKMSHRLCQSPPCSVGTQGTQAELLHLQFSYEKCPTTHCCGFSLDSWSAKAQLMTLVLDPAGLWRGRAAGFCRAPRPLWPGQPSKSQETSSCTTQGENTANWSRTKYPTTYHDSNYTI